MAALLYNFMLYEVGHLGVLVMQTQLLVVAAGASVSIEAAGFYLVILLPVKVALEFQTLKVIVH